MRRSQFALVVLPLLSIGCADTEAAIRLRAANELRCPGAQIALRARPDLTSNTYDVSACGVAARYTCARGYYSSGEAICIREPVGP